MHHHHSVNDGDRGDGRLRLAIALNLFLTLVEVTAGALAGSLALVADGVHNLHDSASLLVALVAGRIARRPSDQRRTFGYRRAEIIGALVNVTVLSVVSLYLVYEAVARLFSPPAIDGWIVVAVATAALAVNMATAGLLHSVSHGNMNLRAAFLHNVGDALSSLGVIISGVAVLVFKVTWLDAVLTFAIAAYILWQCLPMLARSTHILLESVPADINVDDLVADLQTIDGVAELHHVHVWEMDEEHRALEAHVVVAADELARWVDIKRAIKLRLAERFSIHHTTLELETQDESACQECPPAIRDVE